jgi:hypothetical protein
LGTTTRHIFDYAGFYGLAIESSNSSTLDKVKFYGSTLGNSAQLTTSLSSNVWYMISATFQPSGTVTVYVDKTSVGTFTAAAFTAPSSTNYLTIGTNSARTTFWNGQIGPVLFYNTLQNATSVGTFTAAAFTAPSSTNYLTIGSNSARTTFWNGQIGPVLFYNTLQNATSVGQVYDYFSPTYK